MIVTCSDCNLSAKTPDDVSTVHVIGKWVVPPQTIDVEKIQKMEIPDDEKPGLIKSTLDSLILEQLPAFKQSIPLLLNEHVDHTEIDGSTIIVKYQDLNDAIIEKVGDVTKLKCPGCEKILCEYS